MTDEEIFELCERHARDKTLGPLFTRGRSKERRAQIRWETQHPMVPNPYGKGVIIEGVGVRNSKE